MFEVIVMSSGIVVEAHSFASEADALDYANYKSDQGFKVRVLELTY